MKRILVISLVLALAMVLLLPSIAMAKSSTFNATGVNLSIDNGNVKPLGGSGQWLVTDRHITGTFVEGSSVSGDFTLTYGGVFNIADQSGHLVGTLKAGSSSFMVIGDTKPIQPMAYPAPDADGDVVLPCYSEATGKWVGLKGIAANGEFTSGMVLIVYYGGPNSGHVKSVVKEQSAFYMTGKYCGKK